MIDARWVALPKWTRTPGLAGRPAAFKMTYTATLDKLEFEVRKLDASDVRIEAGYASHQIRNDGWPRGGQAPAHPGVVIYFTGRDGELCFPCGTYSSMHANLHAIALTLECLRAVDRYGVTMRAEQYRGFLALPEPAANLPSLEQAADFIAQSAFRPGEGYLLLQHAAEFASAYRSGAGVLHPDAPGGNVELWHRFQRAAALLRAHHKLPGGAGSPE